jgi:hypothetical protein
MRERGYPEGTVADESEDVPPCWRRLDVPDRYLPALMIAAEIQVCILAEDTRRSPGSIEQQPNAGLFNRPPHRRDIGEIRCLLPLFKTLDGA